MSLPKSLFAPTSLWFLQLHSDHVEACLKNDWLFNQKQDISEAWIGGNTSAVQIQCKRRGSEGITKKEVDWSWKACNKCTQCRCDVNTRSNVSQGFCQQIRLAHICTESDQLKTKSNPGKFLRKCSFSDFWAKIGVFWGWKKMFVLLKLVFIFYFWLIYWFQ